MTYIPTQQEFLPTNLSIDYNSPLVLPSLIFLFGMAALLVLMFCTKLGPKPQRLLLVIFTASLSVSMVLAILAMVDLSAQEEEVPVTNKANLIKNIESVYDVEWVRVETVPPTAESLEVTLSQDDVVYSAIVFQDPETFEPSVTLITGVEKAKELRKK